MNKEKYFEIISLSNLKKKIEQEFDELIVLFSPVHLCQLHILFDYEKILEILNEYKQDSYFEKHLNYFLEIFYEDHLRNRIEEILLSGVSKISDFLSKKQTRSLSLQTKGSNMKELLKFNFIDKQELKEFLKVQ